MTIRFFRAIAVFELLLAIEAAAPHATDAAESTDARSATAISLALAGSDSVAQFERIEFELRTSAAAANPYDPDDLTIDVSIRSPSGRSIRVPAFLYQPFDRQLRSTGGKQAEWLYPISQAVWGARFAPDEVGAYSATALLKLRAGEGTSSSVAFHCTPSSKRGFVRVSDRDRRFFEFSDGTPFFPIGQNVAFIGPNQYVDIPRLTEIFRKLSDNGANFARVWACAEDWALAIEARKSAWGRSWNWNPPIIDAPRSDGYHGDERCLKLAGDTGASIRAEPSLPTALRPNTEYVLSARVMSDSETAVSIELDQTQLGEPMRSDKRGQWFDVQRRFKTAQNQFWLRHLTLRLTAKATVWIRHLSLKESVGGPELLWEADPDRPARGVYNQPDAFMLDEVIQAAEQRGIFLQLCLLTRDNYRSALKDESSVEYQRAIDDARKLLRYAVARWGYSPNVAAWEYFNEMDPGAPTDRFYRELGEYLHRIDWAKRPRTTSAWSPAPKYWAHPQLDIADLHWYLRPTWGELSRNEVAAVLDRTRLVRSQQNAKPALLAEWGLADDKWGLSPYMAQDKEWTHFHNSLWASAFSGLSGTVCFWWWDTLDHSHPYVHYKPIAQFLADIPFLTKRLEAQGWSSGSASVMGWRGDDCAYAWIFNPKATWWNEVVAHAPLSEIKGESFLLEKFRDGAYRVQWWDTREGRTIREETAQGSNQRLRVSIPNFLRDLACKITPLSGHDHR